MNIEKFRQWLIKNGAIVLDSTNEFEIIRFESRKGLGLIYANKRGMISRINAVAKPLTDAFETGLDLALSPIKSSRRSLSTVMMELLSARDGWNCFYCGTELTSESCTGEHLCPKAHGGPNHPSNMVLSCEPCNQKAGNLPIVEKLKLQRRKK